MSGWTDGQVREFARQFAFSNKATWPAYVDDVRDAMIGHHVLNVVLGQDRSGRHDDVSIREIRSLLLRLARVLSDKHHMASPLAEQARDADDRPSVARETDESEGAPVQIRDGATAGLARCRLCDLGAPRVGGVHHGGVHHGSGVILRRDTPCDRVFTTRGEGADTARPWLAHVDGVVLRKRSGEARRFASASSAYAAATSAAHAADRSTYALAEAMATDAPIAEYDEVTP